MAVEALDDQTLRILLERARAAVGAAAGWIVAARDDGAEVVVVSGAAGNVRPGVVAHGGSATYVMSSGQPLALAPRAGDAFTEDGIVSLLERPPSSLLSVPCLLGEDAVGAMELTDKDGGGRFSLDDLEVASAFADIAGPALTNAGASVTEVIGAEQLASELRRLEHEDPDRFRLVSWAVAALLSSG